MKFKAIAFSVLTAFLLGSCQPEPGEPPPNNPPNPPAPPTPPVVTGPDSTLLVKNASVLFYDENGVVEDSIRETYQYDTVNRKISIDWKSSDDFDGVRSVLTYNTKKLLSQVNYTYPAGWAPGAEDINSIAFTYDNADILQSVLVNYRSAPPATTVFTKTTLAAGYQLEWLGLTDATQRSKFSAQFNPEGRCIKKGRRLTYSFSGNISTTIFTDTLTYDGAGNYLKMDSKAVDSATQATSTETAFEYLSRQTKGDQLYNQRRLLLNGIQNIPVDFEYSDWYNFTLFTAPEYDEYTKYPFQTVKLQVGAPGSTSYQNYNGQSVFDSKERLVDFKGYFSDVNVLTQRYKLEYYKN
jgi:hypothetical protein